MQLRLTPVVKWMSISFLAIFIVQHGLDQFAGTNLTAWLGLVPRAFVFELRFWQIFTYSFLHADVMHLALNAMMLIFIGSELESLWGARRFIQFFAICTVSAGLFYLILNMAFGSGVGLVHPLVGSSGGLYGLLVAYGILFSERQLLFMMIFPMKAKHFVWLLAGVEFLNTVFSSSQGGLAGVAHLGGMIGGFILLVVQANARKRKSGNVVENALKAAGASLSKKKNASAKKSHLRLVTDNVKEFDKDEKPHDPKKWN